VADLDYSVTDRIGTILLNRPARKNAFTLEMVDRWADLLQEAESDPEVRAIIVTGAGDAFCSGVDLDTIDHASLSALDRKRQLTDRIHRVALTLEGMSTPVIAALNGAAVGAGLDMALMCDMRVAARSARLSEGYVRVGLVPGDGGCYYLPRLVGTAKALELLLTGDFVDGEEAARIGMVNQVVDDDALLAASRALAEKIAAAPPVAVGMIKRATYQSARVDLRTALDLISSHFGVVVTTDDSEEALNAFRERRPGIFHGR
jgi:enoyl-CoA hydratase/carnithine racemase